MIKKTKIEGLFLIESGPKHEDDRGFFRETFYRNEIESFIGKEWNHVQENLAHSKKNVLRGIHAAPWSKMMHVPCGEVQAVIVDLRPNSPTFKVVEPFTLSSDNGLRILLPPGVGNSYCVVSDVVALEYQVDSYFKQCFEKGIVERGVLYNDPDLNIKWPEENLIVSEKDKNNPTLQQFLDQGFAEELQKNIQLLQTS